MSMEPPGIQVSQPPADPSRLQRQQRGNVLTLALREDVPGAGEPLGTWSIRVPSIEI